MNTFNLPDLGEGLAEAEIVRWHVEAGDRISADAPLLAVETAKAIVEVPSPFSGTIAAIHGKPGDTVATGALLVEFAPADAGTVVGAMPTADESFRFGAGPSASGSPSCSTSGAPNTGGANNPPDSAISANPDRVRAIPAARALATRLGLDITQIQGTGRGQLVTVDDVLRMTPARVPPIANLPHRNIGEAQGAQLPGVASQDKGEKLKGPRRAMAQSMATSRDHVMGCTLFDDADLQGWQPEQDITSRILRAIAEGCGAEPGLNAWFDGEALTRQVLSHIDVAIAVDTPEGLIVPVIRNIRGRPVAELRRDVDRLKRDTRERTVRPEDLRNFTFMLSNFGMIAGRYATPVVVPPAVAILGCGRLSHDVIATQNRIEAHRRMPLSLTFDHRCVTGGEAARFLAAVIRDLQKGN
jgi:2-oxoisovalerate dehydrogenase E2 component (dihydrolipoyl transacylase)